ncbi:hypothetical protein [Methanobacterium sp. ACI-7]|uniref:hypothetical protein n=1 Tax=unclassified Methanobacterium TaxID=2627676 RepID=UPI0039C0D4D3
MDNKIVALVIVILLVVVGAAYFMGTQNSNTPVVALNSSNGTNKSIDNILHNETKHKNDTKTNNTTNVKISAQQAQQLAVQAMKEDFGFDYKAGKPTLYAVKETPWWHVPLYDLNGTFEGYVDVNAITGGVYG